MKGQVLNQLHKSENDMIFTVATVRVTIRMMNQMINMGLNVRNVVL